MKKVLHIIPTLNYGGISSVICNWHDTCHDVLYHFDYISFNDGPLKEKFLNDGSKVNIIPTLRKNPLLYFYNTIQIILKGKYEVIHVHNSFKNCFFLLIAKLLKVKKRVSHSHTSGLEDKSLNLYLPLLKWMTITFSNIHIACGKEAGFFLYGNNKFLIINNSIDIERIFNVNSSEKDIKKKYNIPFEKNIIGHIGRFSNVKNHSFIIDLASKANEKYHFVLIGNGPDKENVINNIKNKKLSNKFTLIDPTTDIPRLLSVFDTFILPSKFEGVSLALLEAQAAALNCLVSDRIPPENDVGLNLISFLPLENIDKWLDRLDNLNPSTIPKNQIIHKFNSANLTNKSLYNQLKQIYD